MLPIEGEHDLDERVFEPFADGLGDYAHRIEPIRGSA